MKNTEAPLYHIQIVCPKCGHNIHEKLGTAERAGWAADDKILARCANRDCLHEFSIPIGMIRGICRIEKLDPLPF